MERYMTTERHDGCTGALLVYSTVLTFIFLKELRVTNSPSSSLFHPPLTKREVMAVL